MTDNSTTNYHKAAKQRILCYQSIVLFAFVFVTELAMAQSGDGKLIQTFENVSYKRLSADSALNLDIFLPDTNARKKYPVVVIIHGGGWVEGDKTLETIYYMQRLKSELLRNSFAVISINYRHVGKDIHLPVPIEDCKDAVRWLRAHANEYRLDTANIGLWGGSAGGHLALMAAYTKDEEFVGNKVLSSNSAGVNYVVDNFGPTNLNELFKVDLGWFSVLIGKIFYKKVFRIREQLAFAMTGHSLKNNKKKVNEINNMNSPIYYVNETTVPTIIFHGTKDNVVPILQSENLKKALDEALVPNELIIVKDGDHGFNNRPKEVIHDLIDRSIAFIKKQQK